MTMHVVPINDLREHIEQGTDCWCKPEVDDSGEELLVVHNALDQREKYETGELKPQ